MRKVEEPSCIERIQGGVGQATFAGLFSVLSLGEAEGKALFELIQVGSCTYYFNCSSRIGVIIENESEAYLIDSGNCQDCARFVGEALEQRGWRLKAIINTHGHADHIAGNHLLQEQYGCPIYAAGMDVCFINNTVLAPTYMFGGYAVKDLHNRYLMATSSVCQELRPEHLPTGAGMLRLDGHSFAMSAISSPDGVWFIGDAVAEPSVSKKYHVPYVYDVRQYKNSLVLLETLKGALFIPSHSEPVQTEELLGLVQFSRELCDSIIETLLEVCVEGLAFDQVIAAVFDRFGMRLSTLQYALAGSALRSYLGYLREEKLMNLSVSHNSLIWTSKS